MNKNLEQILQTEFSDSFVSKMKNAMLTSYYKYGEVKLNYPHPADAIESLKLRIKKYEETVNKDCLVDISNFAMIKYMYPKHPNAHYRPTDSDESTGLVGTSIKEVLKEIE